MPCYNKEAYISEMLDSIIGQKWNNIELILINDGSTDGTYDIILAYEKKILARGYTCVIINQKNAGCCFALKTGLSKITGEYVCVVDSDDELDIEYVSMMATWLENKKEYDFTFCDYILYTGIGEHKDYKLFHPKLYDYENGFPSALIEHFLLGLMPGTGWVYMVRVEYLHRCGIVQNFITDTPCSYEPGFIIPLLANGGKYKYFPLPLYKFNVGCDGHSKPRLSENGAYPFQDEYFKISKIIINNFHQEIADEVKKLYWIALASFFRLKMCADRAYLLGETSLHEKYYTEGIIFVKTFTGIEEEIDVELLRISGGLHFAASFMLPINIKNKNIAHELNKKIGGVTTRDIFATVSGVIQIMEYRVVDNLLRIFVKIKNTGNAVWLSDPIIKAGYVTIAMLEKSSRVEMGRRYLDKPLAPDEEIIMQLDYIVEPSSFKASDYVFNFVNEMYFWFGDDMPLGED